LQEKGLSIVFFDRVAKEMNTHNVVVDNFKGAYDATEHLIKNGHQNIAAIAASKFLSITSERIEGYKAALTAHGIKTDESYIKNCFYGGMLFAEVEEAVHSLLSLKHRPNAIFAASDKLTVGCLQTLKKNEINVPGDIALAGFSNSDIADLLNPSLTTVRQPAFEMGKTAIELLLRLIESRRPVTEFEKRVLKPELNIRESSGRNRGKCIAPCERC
jgi:LacI family transcriptional regulator